MSLLSTYFIIYMIILIQIYYLVPKKAQWGILLVASLIFYAFGGWKNLIYIAYTSLTAFAGTLLIDKVSLKEKEYLKANKELLTREDKKLYKSKVKKKKKAIMLLTIVLNLGVLVFFKFLNPIDSLLAVAGFDALDIIIPLGISYYTLQTVGYVVDVYWNNIEAEKNYLKVLLFVSFFPQITQGPISDFKQLSSEIFGEHEFTYKNYSWGFQRMVWGFFKKLIIATIMSPYVKNLFENYRSYTGITLFIGIFVVMIQLYADFSGYMDIVCGACEMLDIRLSENFNRPFFSKSLSEFWRRWHITLGVWFKKYVFFTVGTSKLAERISDKTSKKGKAEIGEKIISTIALLVIWFSIGIWHSVNLPFILWGLITGGIMILSVWLEPLYLKTKKLLHINDNSKLWQCFQMARTFTLVSALEVFSDAGSLKDGTGYLLQLFKSFTIFPKSLIQLLPYLEDKEDVVYYLLALSGIFLMFVISMIERKQDFRVYFSKVPMLIRILILVGAVIVISAFGVPEMMKVGGGFLYAEF